MDKSIIQTMDDYQKLKADVEFMGDAIEKLVKALDKLATRVEKLEQHEERCSAKADG